LIRTDPNKATPARLFNDGVDFMPASASVLFGYQFKSIAALGPIVGPIVAVQWGWLPAILWLVLGVFVIGWIQNYVSAVIHRRGGRCRACDAHLGRRETARDHRGGQ
jgi:carbon starvation protein